MTNERALQIREELYRTAATYDWNNDVNAVEAFLALIDELIAAIPNTATPTVIVDNSVDSVDSVVHKLANEAKCSLSYARSALIRNNNDYELALRAALLN
jgi:hypothetical protein